LSCGKSAANKAEPKYRAKRRYVFMRQKPRELCERAKVPRLLPGSRDCGTPDDFASAAKLLMTMTLAASDFRAKSALLPFDNPNARQTLLPAKSAPYRGLFAEMV
jgi:hypothetical protein